MIIFFALLYPLLAASGLLDGLPSFSEIMSGSFLEQYLGAINANVPNNNLLNPEFLQAYLQQGNTPFLINESLLAQPKHKIHRKKRHHKKHRKDRQSNNSNVMNRKKRYRSGLNNKENKKQMVIGRHGLPNRPYFVKKNRYALASRNIKNHNFHVDPSRDIKRGIDTTNIDNKMKRNRVKKVVKVIRKIIVTTTEKDDSAAVEKYLDIENETNENINKSLYTITNESNYVPITTTTNGYDSNLTVSNAWDKVGVNHTRSFKLGNNTVVKEESTYEGEVHVEDIQQPQEPYVTKYIEHCPESGYILKKDQQGPQEICYLCYCRQNETALCWPRNNLKCDKEHYQHNVVKKIEHARVRRSPFSLGNLFNTNSAPAVAQQECKPHEDSKSEGCPPLDWCVGCNVCDCDAKGMWECHLLSFCSEDDKRKKQLRDMILSTTPKVDKALRKMAREEASRITAAMVAEKRKKQRIKMGKDLRSKYFFKNGTLINQTLFNIRKRIRSRKLDDFNSTQREAFEKYNLKVRNKDPNLYKKFQVVTGKQAKKVVDANLRIRGIKDKQDREKMAEKNKKAMIILAKRKVLKDKSKQKIFIPAGLQIPEKFRSARFKHLIGGGLELATETVKNPIRETVNKKSVKSAIIGEFSEVSGNTEKTRKPKHPTRRRRKVRKVIKELLERNNLNVLNFKPRLRRKRKPMKAADAIRKPLRRMNVKKVNTDNAKTTERNKVNKKKSNTKLSTTSPKKYLKTNHSRNASITSSTVKPHLKKEIPSNLQLGKNLKVGKTKQKSTSNNKATTTKKPVPSNKTIESKQKASKKTQKANNSTNKVEKLHSKSGKQTTKTLSAKKGIQKAPSKDIKVIIANHSIVNETLGKLTPQINEKPSLTKSSKKVKRSIQNKSPRTTLSVEGIFRRSYRPGVTAIKFDVLGKQIYTNRNDIKNKGVQREFSNYQSSAVVPGSHKIWLHRRRRRKPNTARLKTNRVAKVIKPIANQEQNDTRRLSIPFIRNSRQIPSSNNKEPRPIQVSNLQGYIRSQSRKYSQNQLVSLINERIQKSINLKGDYYKSTTNHHLLNERPKKNTAPVNVENSNYQQAANRNKYSQAQANVDNKRVQKSQKSVRNGQKSVQKRQKSEQKRSKRKIQEGTSSFTTMPVIKKLNHRYKKSSQRAEILLEEIQKLAFDRMNEEAKFHDRYKRYLKATSLMTEANEWRIPTKTIDVTNQIPSEFSYYKYTVEEATNKIPILGKSKDYITETIILRNKNTEAKRSVDSHLPVHDAIFTQKFNESNIKTRSIKDAYNKGKISNNFGETFTMIEGIRDIKKNQKRHNQDDVQMTFTIPISSEIKAGDGETIHISQDITGLPNQVKTPSMLDKAVVIVHRENDSSQESNSTILTESLLIRPMSFAPTESNYVGVNNLLSWMPAESRYIDSNNNNAEPSVTESNMVQPQTKALAQYNTYTDSNIPKYIIAINTPIVEMVMENKHENVSTNESNNSSHIESDLDNIFSTKQSKLEFSPNFNNMTTEKIENINKYRKEYENITVPPEILLDSYFNAIKTNSQSDRYNISTLNVTRPSFEHEDNGNISTNTNYHYVPLGTLFKNNANKKTAPTEQIEVLIPVLKLKKKMPTSYENVTYTSNPTTEKKENDSNVVTTNANKSTVTVNPDSITEDYTTSNLGNLSKTTENAYKFPKKNIKSYEIKKLSLKKYQLKKIVPTLYSNKIRDKQSIIADDISKTLKNNKTNDLKNILKNLLNGINIKNKKIKHPKTKRLKILKYLQNFFKTMFASNGKNIKKHLNSTIIKKNMVDNLCVIFGPCNINVKNDAKLQYQIDNLNLETFKMLHSIKIIKGLLKLVDFRREDQVKNMSKSVRSYFKSDVQKLRAILKESYLLDDAFKNLTTNQKIQIAYIKNNTQHFIQSAAKFTMILNEIINIISTPESTRNETVIYPKKMNEIIKEKEEDKDSFKKNLSSYKSDATVVLPLKKLKDLITKYNFIQNTFMRKMFKILTHIFPKNIETTESNKKTHVRKINKTEAIQMYTKNIIQNLRKLKALAQNVDGSIRRKRHIRSDDSLEYMLMMMEFLLKQNHQLDYEPENDGIDLLLDAIKSAPDIKAIKKKVLQTNLHKTETYTDKKLRKNNNTRRKNTDKKIATLMPSEDRANNELRTSTPAFKDDISEEEINQIKEDNFTSKMEDSIINIIDQDDEEDEDDAQPYYYRKPTKQPTVEKVRPYDQNYNKLATVKGNLDNPIYERLEDHVHSKSEYTTEINPDHTKKVFQAYMDDLTLNKGTSNSLETKENNEKNGNDRSKSDTAEDDADKTPVAEQMPLTAPPKFIGFTTEPGSQMLDDSQRKAVPSVRSEWVDETYEELKESDANYSSTTGPSTTDEDLVTEFVSDATTVSPKVNDISGMSKETLVPLEVLNFERQMHDVSDRSWLKAMGEDYGKEGGAFFVVSSKENESTDKYADETETIRSQ